MKRTISIKEIQNMNVGTFSIKDNSARGCKTISASDVKVGNAVVLNNHFVTVTE